MAGKEGFDNTQAVNLAGAYQDNVAALFRAIDRTVTLRKWYDAFGLSLDDNFPEDVFVGTSLEGKLTRDEFRSIVSNLDEIGEIIDKVSGRRETLAKILDGVPS